MWLDFYIRKGEQMKGERLTLTEAASEIGCHPEYVRRQMACGNWDLGTVVKKKNRNGCNQYFVFRSKLDKFLGKETEVEQV